MCLKGYNTMCSSVAAAIMMTKMVLRQIVFDASHPFLFIIKEADSNVIQIRLSNCIMSTVVWNACSFDRSIVAIL